MPADTIALSTLQKPSLLARKRQFTGPIIPPAPAAPPAGSAAARDSALMPPPPAKKPRRANIDEDATEESAAERTLRQQHGAGSVGSQGSVRRSATPRAPAAPTRRPGANNDAEFLLDGSEITSSPDISSASATTASGAAPSRLQNGVVRSHISGGSEASSSSGQRSAIDVLVQQSLNQQQQVARPGTAAPAVLPAGAAAAAAALARAPAAAPVGRGRAADPDHCPVCREQFTAQFEQLQQAQGAAATTTSAKNNNNKRDDKVRSHIMRTTGDRYKLIFRIESVLRGMVSDEQLIPLLLELHRDLIESVLRKHPGIRFHPWTHRMLTEHFNIDNEHIFDPIREAVRDLRICRKAVTVMESRYLVPDPDNPAQRIVDHRVITSLCKMSERKEGLISKIQSYHKMKEENLAESIFALLSVISHQAADRAHQVTQDVRMAAGTMIVGGDTMRSAGTSMGTAVGTAHDFYALSGY